MYVNSTSIVKVRYIAANAGAPDGEWWKYLNKSTLWLGVVWL